jgi:hypothetical protein
MAVFRTVGGLFEGAGPTVPPLFSLDGAGPDGRRMH